MTLKRQLKETVNINLHNLLKDIPNDVLLKQIKDIFSHDFENLKSNSNYRNNVLDLLSFFYILEMNNEQIEDKRESKIKKVLHDPDLEKKLNQLNEYSNIACP